MKRSIVLVIALVVVIGGISAGLSLATPGAGTVSAEFGRRTVQALHVNMSKKGDIVVAENSYAPGGYSGWHSHPGKVVIAVQRGAITIYRGDDPQCQGKTFQAGQVFIERPGVVYDGRNESTTTAAVLNATFFNVPEGGAVRIDQPQPSNCSF
ncbi:MAG: cupin domain-containing protein [Actinomycetota bacterium]|nr:cupin domain-containing protein [Actinomycetota bacterium]